MSQAGTSEEQTDTKSVKKAKGSLPPKYFSENLNILIASYSASPPETKLWLSRDIIGHIWACLHKMGKLSSEHYTEYMRAGSAMDISQITDTHKAYSYQTALTYTTVLWENAAVSYFNGKYSESMILLGRLMDTLSQIVANENLTSDNIVVIGSPLETPSLADDTVSRRYIRS